MSNIYLVLAVFITHLSTTATNRRSKRAGLDNRTSAAMVNFFQDGSEQMPAVVPADRVTSGSSLLFVKRWNGNFHFSSSNQLQFRRQNEYSLPA